MIRIAYILSGFYVGGIERCVAHLVNHLDRERFQPEIVALSNSGGAAEWVQRDDVPILELHKRPGNDPAAVWRLARLLRTRAIEIVHSHNWGALVETVLARRLAGVPVHVHTEHGQEAHAAQHGFKQRFRRQAARWAYSRTDALVACAESVRPIVAERAGLPREKVHFLPNGVEDPLQESYGNSARAIRRQLGIPDRARIVGSVGRLVDVKDYPTALECLARLGDEPVPVHLVLVGDGPRRDDLQRRSEELELADRVHFAGRQFPVGPWLRTFDVYLNCSTSEAMSLGVLEAMGAGLPLVVTDVGDNRSLVDGPAPCGRVAPPRDIPRLTDALRTLLRDEALRRRLSAAARSKFERDHTTTAMTARHESLYTCLSGKGTAGEFLNRSEYEASFA